MSKFNATQEDINQYVLNGGDLVYLTREQIEAIPQEIINQYVVNGGCLDRITTNQEESIPQDVINQRAANGGSLERFRFNQKQIAAIPQDIINQRAANGGSLEIFYKTYVTSWEPLSHYILDDNSYTYYSYRKLIEAIPQEIINQYVASGRDMGHVTFMKISEIPRDLVNEYYAMGCDLDKFTDEQESEISNHSIERREYNIKSGKINAFSPIQIKTEPPQDVINQRAINCGSLYGVFTEEQIAAIPQDIINKIAINGGYLYHFTDEQIAEIPQDIVNQYALNGGSLEALNNRQRNAITIDIRNQRAVKGRGYNYKYDDRPSVSQDITNQFVLNGGYLGELDDARTKAVPKEIIYQRIANTGWHPLDPECTGSVPNDIREKYSLVYGDLCLFFDDEEQLKAIPKDLITTSDYSDEIKNAIVLYSLGKITKEELPIEVFANYKTRKDLLNIIKVKLFKHFQEICYEMSFKGKVPDEVKMAFDKKCEEIEKEINEKKDLAVKQILSQQEQEKETRKNDAIGKITGMGW